MSPEDLDFHLLFVRARVPVAPPVVTVPLSYPRSDWKQVTERIQHDKEVRERGPVARKEGSQ